MFALTFIFFLLSFVLIKYILFDLEPIFKILIYKIILVLIKIINYGTKKIIYR